MVIIWRPPAVFIIVTNGLIFFVGLGALLVQGLHVMEPGDRAGVVMASAWGVGIILSDAWYRRRAGMTAFDLSRSTVFWFIPTWVVGIGVILLGLYRWG
jgi:hypothetical protein